jgi:hypothetical protein
MFTHWCNGLRRALLFGRTTLLCFALLAGAAFTSPAHAGSLEVIADGGNYPYTAIVHL